MPKTSRSAKKSKPARRKVAVRKSVTRKTAPKKKAVTRKTIPKKKVASKKQLVARKKVAAPKKPTPKVKATARTKVKARAKVTPPRPAKVVPAKPAPAAVKPTKSRLIKANVAAPGSQMPGVARVAQTEGATESVLQIGQLAPDFRLPANDGRVISLSEFRGRKVVLYFYPKDDTPGCTKEACSFRDGLTEIEQRGAVVLGVSVDPIDSHQMFHEKFGLNYPLLSDEWKEVVQAYGVWKERSHEGRAYMTTERTTFVIDEDGRIARIFPKVQVEGHFDEVLAAL